MTNCPNCAAPITGPRCEYCDTVFGEYADSRYVPREEFDLLRAKTAYLKDYYSIQQLYADAIKAMRRYGR